MLKTEFLSIIDYKYKILFLLEELGLMDFMIHGFKWNIHVMHPPSSVPSLGYPQMTRVWLRRKCGDLGPEKQFMIY